MTDSETKMQSIAIDIEMNNLNGNATTTSPAENESKPAMEIAEIVEEKQRMSSLQSSYATTAIHAIFWAYFAWATKHFYNSYDDKQSFRANMDFCKGYGLIVLVAAAYYGKKVLGPVFGKLFDLFIRLQRTSKIIHMIPYVIVACILITYFVVNRAHYGIAQIIPAFGLLTLLGGGFLFSHSRKDIKWIYVVHGVATQLLLGMVLIKWETGQTIVGCVSDKATDFMNYTYFGSTFVFGESLVRDQKVFTFDALSVVIYISFITEILYYFGIMQRVVMFLGSILQRYMGTTMCESVNAAANIILSNTESTFLFRPYLGKLTKSEYHAFLTSGFATVTGSLLPAYVSFGANARDIITASVMAAPASLSLSKIVYPETEESLTKTKKDLEVPKPEESFITLCLNGVTMGVQSVLGIVGTVLSLLAFVAFLDYAVSWVFLQIGFVGITLHVVLAYFFMPFAFLMGIPFHECYNAGQLLATKLIVNEFVAYQEMGKLLDLPVPLICERTKTIISFALCSFSNPGAVGVQMGVMNILAPNRRDDIAKVIISSFLAGFFTSFITACTVAILTI